MNEEKLLKQIEDLRVRRGNLKGGAIIGRILENRRKWRT